MFDRALPALKILCVGLALLMLFQFLRLALRADPLARVTIPAPLLPRVDRPPAPTGKATNSVPRAEAARTETEVPADVQARVERIKQSEIFGPIQRPMSLPVALLGIAGPDVFLRTPSGQTGLLREGETLGTVKLLRIGTNRVLVDLDGQTQELTIFSGFGSPSLLPERKENPQ